MRWKNPRKTFWGYEHSSKGSIKITSLSRLRIWRWTDIWGFTLRASRIWLAKALPVCFFDWKAIHGQKPAKRRRRARVWAGNVHKPDKRAVTLRALKLKAGMTLWDMAGAVPSTDAFKGWRVKSFMFGKKSNQMWNHRAQPNNPQRDVLQSYILVMGRLFWTMNINCRIESL